MSRSSLRNGSKRVQQFVTLGNFLDNSRKVLFTECGSCLRIPLYENTVSRELATRWLLCLNTRRRILSHKKKVSVVQR